MKLREFIASIRMAQRLKSFGRLERDACVPCRRDDTIVSLTSIPERLPGVYLTVLSLLAQTVRPFRILLWLHYSLEESIPTRLSSLVGPTFEIRYVELTCPHRKLVHSLREFPSHSIVTCDDDQLYPSGWLEGLLRESSAHPGQIVANVCRVIQRDKFGFLKPYRDWRHLDRGEESNDETLPIGYAGVLYPPGSLDSSVTDSTLFLRLAPTADDLWFKAMSLLRGTKIHCPRDFLSQPLEIVGSRRSRLSKLNVNEDRNRVQWDAICSHFGWHPSG